MILFDTETTGLATLPDTAPLSQQPRIIEFAALRVNNKTLKVEDELEFLCNPGIALPEVITKVTGLKDEDLKCQAPFGARFHQLVNFFLGERHLVAHNISFDRQLLAYDLARIGKGMQFPWPMNHFCTSELTSHLGLPDRKFTTLYEHITGKKCEQSHRAMGDVRQLLTVVQWLKKKKILEVV